MKNSIIILVVFLFFYFLEKKFPLRTMVVKSTARLRDNLLLAILGIPFTRFLAYPFVYKVAMYSEENNLGLFHHIDFHPGLIFFMSFILLDYCLYWWHRLNHKIAFFWRFHQVHHADPEMDASTALRFHFGELLLSSAVRILLILFFGFSLSTLLVFDVVVTSCALFHHSNLKLPEGLEKVLIKIAVTPLFHQNHHSYFQKETDSNYSAVFSVWDRLHSSHTKEVSNEVITIGLPSIGKVVPGIYNLLIMPIKKVSAWPKKYISRSL